jgi:hypothetical protein
MNDLAKALTLKEKDMNIKHLITSIIGTMSDQSTVNPVFNERLQSLRQEILPTVYENWKQNMDVQSKNKFSKLITFFAKCMC